MNDQPKLCECGCGQPAPIAKKTSAFHGHVKGQPVRFVSGHNARVVSDELRQRFSEVHSGRKRSLATRENMRVAKFAQTIETRRRISVSHGGTGKPTVKAIHQRLARHHPKTGTCEDCGKRGRTDYAFLRHPEPHTENRSDYRELCRSCHVKFDRR